jgi:hypothetical protein
MPNNLVVSGNLTINGTATYVNTESISSKDPLFEVANTNNTTDAVDIGYYGRYYDAVQERVEFTGLFRDASDAGKFKIFNGLVDEPTNVVNTTGTGYTVATLVANVDGNLNGTANAANILSTARTISATGDAAWSVSFDGSANATAALTLANTGVTATTYGTSTAVPTIAVDSKGRITSASNTNITFPVTTVNGFAGTVVLTTSDVAEGSNQYFTTARAQAAITGGASSVVTANLTASRALVSDGSGKIAASATTTTTEVGYLAGVTSAIQTQLNGKLNLTGGTLTGGLIGTTGSFSSSGSGDTFTIGHTSGSGIALNITKGGNGEGLYINKTSGSGNAATIIGTLNATTLVKSGGTASQFLMADGSVNTSVLASGAYLPLAGGTLTGALSGTSATFSGLLSTTKTTDGIIEQIGGNATKAYLYQFTSGGVAGAVFNIGHNFYYDGTNYGQGNAAKSGWVISSNLNADSFAIARAAAGSTSAPTSILSFASTGAATFSSSVTASRIVVGAAGTSRILQVNTSGNDGIRILTSGDSPTLDLMQTAAANASARNWRIVTNWEGWGTMDFQSGANNTGDPATTRMTILGTTGNVGIGTSSPSQRFHVANSAGGVVGFFQSTATNGEASVALQGRNSSGTVREAIFKYDNADVFRIGTASNIGLRFETNDIVRLTLANTGAATFTSDLRVNTGGKIIFESGAGTANSLFRDPANGNTVLSTAVDTLFITSTGAERMRITSGGDVIISGTGSGGAGALTVRRDGGIPASIANESSSGTLIRFSGNGSGVLGSITHNGTNVAYNTSSDYRLKQDLKDYNGLELISGIKTYDYEWKSNNSRMYGVIAHELQEVLPYAVTGEKDAEDMQGVDYSKLVPILVKAIQEQQAQIEELKALIAAK